MPACIDDFVYVGVSVLGGRGACETDFARCWFLCVHHVCETMPPPPFSSATHHSPNNNNKPPTHPNPPTNPPTQDTSEEEVDTEVQKVLDELTLNITSAAPLAPTKVGSKGLLGEGLTNDKRRRGGAPACTHTYVHTYVHACLLLSLLRVLRPPVHPIK